MDDNRFDHTTENLVRLRSIKKSLGAMTTTNAYIDHGISTHEKLHIVGMVDKAIDRCIEILTKGESNESNTTKSTNPIR